MLQKRNDNPTEKARIHPRSKHRERYNFKELIQCCPELAAHVRLNAYDDESIDFSDAAAVKMLNTALLKFFYGIDFWDIPAGYLCPPIPGRADYIHHIADLLGSCNNGIIPTGNQIQCLDIGVGANCIYPIIGVREYGWSFTGSDSDAVAIQSASEIVEKNESLKGHVKLRLQPDSKQVLKGIIQTDEHFDLILCNPPFHASLEEAQAGTLRKLSNLNQKRITRPTLNFGGQHSELWCDGGEVRFVKTMIQESIQFASSCFWFSSLVSKQAHLEHIYNAFDAANAVEVKTIPFGQGNKSGRSVAWTFLTKEEQANWRGKWNKGA